LRTLPISAAPLHAQQIAEWFGQIRLKLVLHKNENTSVPNNAQLTLWLLFEVSSNSFQFDIAYF
jgi:hypothetical protein